MFFIPHTFGISYITPNFQSNTRFKAVFETLVLRSELVKEEKYIKYEIWFKKTLIFV